jgi:RecA-family ATPase
MGMWRWNGCLLIVVLAMEGVKDMEVFSDWDNVNWKNLPRPRWLVEGILQAGKTSFVSGPSDSGKTSLALDIAAHVAAGKDWHFGKVRAGGSKVLYWMNRYYTKEMRALKYFDLKNDGKYRTGRNLGLMKKENAPDAIYNPDMLLGAIKEWDWVPELIIFDQLGNFSGIDYYNPHYMGQIIKSVDTITKETGAHVMILHFEGAAGLQGADPEEVDMRAMQMLDRYSDTTIQLKRNGKTTTAEMECKNAPGRRFKFKVNPVYEKEFNPEPVYYLSPVRR